MKNPAPPTTATPPTPPTNGAAEPPPDGSLGSEDSPAATALPLVDEAVGSVGVGAADPVADGDDDAEDRAGDDADAVWCVAVPAECDVAEEPCEPDEPDPPLPAPPPPDPVEWLGEGELAFGSDVEACGATVLPDDVENAQPSRPPTVTCRVPAPSLLYDHELPSVACQYDQ